LAAALDLPVAELDAFFHDKPDWQDATREEFRAKVETFFAAHPDGWVTDGNYKGMVGDLTLGAAETVIWLRLPFRVVYPRLVRRTLKRAVSRELLWGTNRERWRDVFGKESMLVWGIRTWRQHHRTTREMLRDRDPRVRMVVVKSVREVDEYLRRAASVTVGTMEDTSLSPVSRWP
jgi:adenylate kinase family enzyme